MDEKSKEVARNSTFFIHERKQNSKFFIHELNLENLGKAIKNLRKIRGITQAQLAKSLDLSKSQISKIETGTRAISLRLFDKVFKALNGKIYFHGEYSPRYRKPRL